MTTNLVCVGEEGGARGKGEKEEEAEEVKEVETAAG